MQAERVGAWLIVMAQAAVTTAAAAAAAARTKHMKLTSIMVLSRAGIGAMTLI